MKHAPSKIHHFCDPAVEEEERKVLIKWIRDIDGRTSCQHLQILFSFSIPSPVAVEKIMALATPIVSAGAVSQFKIQYAVKALFVLHYCNSLGGRVGGEGGGCQQSQVAPYPFH